MASQLKVDTLTGVTTAGSIAVTAEGNSTTTNLQQGLAKGWAKVNQDTPAFRGSFNMGSLTDSSTGVYELNFTSIFSALDDYVINTNAQAEDYNQDKTEYQNYSSSTTSKANVKTVENNSLRDQSISDNSLLGDLA
jgi:hypothetical protein